MDFADATLVLLADSLGGSLRPKSRWLNVDM